MGDLINLNDFRKRRDKQRAGAVAGENKAKSSRGRNQRRAEALAADRAKTALDGKRLTESPRMRPVKLSPDGGKPAVSGPDQPAGKS